MSEEISVERDENQDDLREGDCYQVMHWYAHPHDCAHRSFLQQFL